MSHELLAEVWFGIWGLIWALYFVLDGYTLGTGLLFPWIAKSEKQEKQLIESIGPFWGGNEVWLITAGGATFAAFPQIYADMFSYLYTPLMLILFCIFFRAVGLEFMYKHETKRWHAFWKWSFFGGSLGIALLFGVAFANLFKGLPFNGEGYYGNLLTLLSSYGLLGGVLFITLFLLSGAGWIAVKTAGPIQERALKWANILWYPAAATLAIFFVATANQTTLLSKFTEIPALWLLPLLAVLAIFASKWAMVKQKPFGAFLMVSLTILSFMATGFAGMFPNMLPSLHPEHSITLYQAAGSQLNLTIMLFVVLLVLPVVLAYRIWAYRIFREKINEENATGY